MFLGVNAEMTNFNDQENSYTLILAENPLIDYVDLPKELLGLHYSNVICGVIRGALEAVLYRVKCYFVKDALKGDDYSEIKVELIQIIYFKSDD